VELLVRIGQPADAPPPETPPPEAATPTTDREWLRMPGLFRRWEFEQVIEIGDEFLVQEAGQDAAGTTLFTVYARPHVEEEGAP
jgi:hypothetical protein